MNDDEVLDLPAQELPDDSLDVLELMTRFLVEWPVGLITSLLLLLIGLGFIYSIEPEFEAAASVLPQNRGGDPTDLATLFSQHSPGEVYLGLLGSRTIEDLVIDRLDLMKFYKLQSREMARATLAGQSKFSIAPNTLIFVQVRNEDAQAAARIANAYVDALEQMENQMSADAAELRSRFLAGQVNRESEALAAAERDLEQTQQATGIVQPEQQTQIGLGAIAQVRSEITSRQTELASLLLGDSEENPAVKSLRAQIAQLEAQESALESAQGGSRVGAAASASRMPQLNLDIARKQRMVRFHETLLTSISNQYENTLLAEGLNSLPFVVVDRAVAPEHKAWPNRKALLTLLIAASVLAGLAAIALKLLWLHIQHLPGNQDRLRRIRMSFPLRRKAA